MECEKCQDKGFTEEEHGLLMVFCDCEKGQAKREEITGERDDNRTEPLDSETQPIDSGTKSVDSTTGSPDTGKPKRTRKPKTKKRARKGTR